MQFLQSQYVFERGFRQVEKLPSEVEKSFASLPLSEEIVTNPRAPFQLLLWFRNSAIPVEPLGLDYYGYVVAVFWHRPNRRVKLVVRSPPAEPSEIDRLPEPVIIATTSRAMVYDESLRN